MIGVLGTVLAIPGLLSLSTVATIIVCVAEVVLLVGVFLAMPATHSALPGLRLAGISLALLTAIALPLVASRALPAAVPHARATYNPFEVGKPKATLQVATETGDCWGGSVANSGRAHAYRCSIADKKLIQDPCFEPLTWTPEPTVICAESPWTPQVTQLMLTSPLPLLPLPSESLASDLPWAVELPTGERCVLYSGATVVLAGERLDYGCDLNEARLYGLDLKAGTARVERPGGGWCGVGADSTGLVVVRGAPRVSGCSSRTSWPMRSSRLRPHLVLTVDMLVIGQPREIVALRVRRQDVRAVLRLCTTSAHWGGGAAAAMTAPHW